MQDKRILQVDPSISYRCSACIWNVTQARIRERIYAWLIQVIQDRSYAAVALLTYIFQLGLAWVHLYVHTP